MFAGISQDFPPTNSSVSKSQPCGEISTFHVVINVYFQLNTFTVASSYGLHLRAMSAVNVFQKFAVGEGVALKHDSVQ